MLTDFKNSFSDILYRKLAVKRSQKSHYTPILLLYYTLLNINVEKLPCNVLWETMFLKDELARQLRYVMQQRSWRKHATIISYLFYRCIDASSISYE